MKSEGAKRRGILKNHRQNSSGKATSLLVVLARAGALPILKMRGSEAFALRWKCLLQRFEVTKDRKLTNAVLGDLREEKERK